MNNPIETSQENEVRRIDAPEGFTPASDPVPETEAEEPEDEE